MDGWNEEELVEKIRCYLRGKIFLVILHDVRDKLIWDHIKLAFPDDCPAGSAIIVTTDNDDKVAQTFSPYKTFNPDSSVMFSTSSSVELYLCLNMKGKVGYGKFYHAC